MKTIQTKNSNLLDIEFDECAQSIGGISVVHFYPESGECYTPTGEYIGQGVYNGAHLEITVPPVPKNPFKSIDESE